MKQSNFFWKTENNTPSDAEGRNARFLIQGGYVDRLMAGVYSLLPIGLRVLRNIEKIVREEMNSISGQELLMPALQPKELWDETGRWEKLRGDMYQFTDSSKKPLGLGFTHEEVALAIARERMSSYKNFPFYIYQIQRKFRDEPRPRSGILRGREFFMKDMYSFHTSKEDLDDFYNNVISKSYMRVLKRMKLEAIYTEAAGGVFTKEHTHEFQVISPAGEDTIFYCTACKFAQNKEIAKVQEGDSCPECKGKIIMSRAIEIANIFRFNDVMSRQMNFFFTTAEGKKQPVFFGSYGFGITRALGTLVEIHAKNEKSIVWPEEIAPFMVHILALQDGLKEADMLHKELEKQCVSVLYDDRENISPGEKFADADFVGAPFRVIVGGKTPKGKIEMNGKKMNPKAFLKMFA